MTDAKPQIPPTIAAHIEHFTGRTWLVPRLLDWLAADEPRIFLLIGGPGTGKSMISAWLAGHGPAPAEPEAAERLTRLRGQVAGVHFCQANSRNLSPQAFAENIANQLTANIPSFSDALAVTLAERVQLNVVQNIGTMSESSASGVAIGRLDLGALGDELSFDRAFTQPVKKLYEAGYDKPLLILVDALDEAQTYTGSANLVQLLARLADLPPQVRILATTRPDPRVLMYYRDAGHFHLITDAPPDNQDMRRYAAARLASAATGLDEAAQERLATQVADKASGVFLYAALVLDDLLPHLPAAANLDAFPLPKGLSGLYGDFLLREVGKEDKPWYNLYEPLLGLIAVAQGDGLTTTQLTALVGPDVRPTLRTSKQYLAGELPEGPFRLFHRSFADFLLEDEDNIDRHIDAATMHRRIATYYWQKHRQDWTGCDLYGLLNLPAHLARSDAMDELRALLLDPHWLQAKLDGVGVAPVLADYDLLPGDPDTRLVQEAIRLSAHVLEKDPVQLFPQLYGRLMTREQPAIRTMLANPPPGPWLRPLTAVLTPAGGALLQKIVASSLGIRQLALIPGGQQVLSAGKDGRAVVWDLQRRVEERSWPLDATSMALTPDGAHLVFDRDGRLFVCDMETRETQPLTLEARAPFAIMPDGQRLVAAERSLSSTGKWRLSIRDRRNGNELSSLPGHDREVSALAVMPDGRRIVSGSEDGELKVWDLEHKARVRPWKPYSLRITALLPTLDGRHVIVATVLGTVSVWDLQRRGFERQLGNMLVDELTGLAPARTRCFGSSVTALALTPAGDHVIVGLNNGTLHIWDWQAEAEICCLPGHELAVSGVAVTQDGERLVSSSEDGTLKIWGLKRATETPRPAPGHAAPVNSVAITSNGRMAITAAGAPDRHGNTLKIWDLGAGAELRTLSGHTTPVEQVFLLPDGRRAVSCSSDTGREDSEIRVWDIDTGTVILIFSWRGAPKALALTPDGRLLIGAFSTSVSVLNLDDGAAQMLGCHETDVCAVAVTRDGRYALTADLTGQVVAWDLEAGKPLPPFCGDSQLITTLAIAADDRLTIGGWTDPYLAIWDWRTGSQLTPLKGHELPVSVAAMTSDGRRLLSGSMDGTIILWDAETGQPLNKFESCDAVRAMAAGGQHVVSASADESLTVWEMAGGRRLATFYTDRPVQVCAISPDGTTVVAGDEDGRVYILRLERVDRRPTSTGDGASDQE